MGKGRSKSPAGRAAAGGRGRGWGSLLQQQKLVHLGARLHGKAFGRLNGIRSILKKRTSNALKNMAEFVVKALKSASAAASIFEQLVDVGA